MRALMRRQADPGAQPGGGPALAACAGMSERLSLAGRAAWRRKPKTSPLASAVQFRAGALRAAAGAATGGGNSARSGRANGWTARTRRASTKRRLLSLSIEKAGALLGWHPAWDFHEAIQQTVAWYHERHALKNPDMLRIHRPADRRLRQRRAPEGPGLGAMNLHEPLFSMPFLRQPRGALILDLGVQPLANNLLRAGGPGKARAEVSAAPGGLRILLAAADPRPGSAGRAVLRVSLFLLVFRSDAAPRARRPPNVTSGNSGWASRAWWSEIASNDGYLLQNFQKQGCPAWGSSRRRTSPRSPAKRESRRWWSSSAQDLACEPGGGGTAGRPDPGQQCLRARAGHERFRRRPAQRC